jgi:hypothetical protein
LEPLTRTSSRSRFRLISFFLLEFVRLSAGTIAAMSGTGKKPHVGNLPASTPGSPAVTRHRSARCHLHPLPLPCSDALTGLLREKIKTTYHDSMADFCLDRWEVSGGEHQGRYNSYRRRCLDFFGASRPCIGTLPVPIRIRSGISAFWSLFHSSAPEAVRARYPSFCHFIIASSPMEKSTGLKIRIAP